MDGDWDEVARVALPPPGVHAVSTPIQAMSFDTSQELLWVGNDYGRASSFYGTELQQYTSFRAHPSADGPVRQFLFTDKGVIALGPKSIHMAMRRGPPIWHIQHEDMIDLRCMSFTSKGLSEILVAGIQNQMFVIDVDKGEIKRQVPTADKYIIMKRSRYICAAADKSGKINILDSTNFSVVKTWTTHAAAINDMDAQHDYIVSCSWSSRGQGAAANYMLDPLVNVFDLKNLSSQPPVPFPAGAAFVRMHPRMSTTSIVVSQLGQMHIVDLINPNTSNVRQVNVLSAYSALSKLEVASSGEAIAMADIENNMHLWGSPSRIRFAELSNPIEFADTEDPSTMAQLGWSVDSPLSSIGVPYYREALLSAWPSNMIFEVGAPPAKLDTQIVSKLQDDHGILWAPNSKNTRRNQVMDTRKASLIQSTPTPAEKSGNIADHMNTTQMHGIFEIAYGKWHDSYNFKHYNDTTYAGLETHISNSYANALLQLLHYTPMIRNVALQHAASSCVNLSCLLCEMGFLFDMLEKASGAPCQASNLLRTLRYHPEAASVGILEENTPNMSYTIMIQNLNRFLLDKMTQDDRRLPPHSIALEQLLTTSATMTIRCMNCRSDHTSPGTGLVNDLVYPVPEASAQNTRSFRTQNARQPRLTFSQILKSSMERDSTGRGWCSKCKRYQGLATRRAIHSVPPVMLLNTCITSPEARALWNTPGWLPDEIGVLVDRQGNFFCLEGDELDYYLMNNENAQSSLMIYSLMGAVADIDGVVDQKSHLVSLINVAHSLDIAPEEGKWHLFNDHLVAPLTRDDALGFSSSWKLPSVVAYQIKSANNRIDNSWKDHLDTSPLYTNSSKQIGEKTYTPLNKDIEHPGPGTVIAIDAEFVTIRRPEFQMDPAGNTIQIRPIGHALARVSVLRGPSPEFDPSLEPGTPFIDDYIVASEPIIDYVTSFSGLSAGDLHMSTSRHDLLTFKTVYKKLWILLNLGCKFLGHGLKTDFRVINMIVPKSQVIDTIDLFYLRDRRQGGLALKYLMWAVFNGEEIQSETHDSIEDARAALRLWAKWREWVDAGIQQVYLDEIYSKGKGLGYKVPNGGGRGDNSHDDGGTPKGTPRKIKR